MKITILGCGPSWGVPKIGGGWGACDPAEPRNRRRRAGIVVEDRGASILVDTPPDLREALLACDIRRIDAVIFTHAHADHLHGIDDLRTLSAILGGPIPAFGDDACFATVRARFPYTVDGVRGPSGGWNYPPILDMHPGVGTFVAAGLNLSSFVQTHGRVPSLGIRCGPMAYSTDVKTLDEAAFTALQGIELWVVDCASRQPLPTHSHLAQTLGWIERVRPRRAILTHMTEDLDYETLKRELPPGIEPAYDGMVIEL